MKLNLKRIVAAGLATLAVSGVATISSINPAAAATNAGVATVKTSGGSADLNSGDGNTVWTLRLPAGAKCATDGTNGGRWHTFMVPESEDIYTSLAFSGTGTLVGSSNGSGGTGTFRGNIPNISGTLIRNQAPNSGDAVIINIPDMQFRQSDGQIPSGVYELGIACTNTTGGDSAAGTNAAVDNVYAQTITVTYPATNPGFANIDWVVGAPAAPEAPTLDSVTPGAGELTAAFTAVESNPATDSFTVTATPTGGGTAVTQTGTASPITVTGLAFGTEYSVTVHATNAEGNSPESNALTTTTLSDPNQQPAVQDLGYTDVGEAGSGEILVDWNPPSTGEEPTGYEVTIDPAAGTVVVDDTNTSASITGLTPGETYQVTVTPLHPAPLFGTPASISATPLASGVTVLEQNVTVIRPAGAVVFTQRCENSATGAPLEGAVFDDLSCAIVFGEARRVFPDRPSSPYWEANASLNNVQVDANGEDTGWTVTGQMSDFVKPDPGGDSFSGDQLGWAPQTIDATPGMTVNPGDPVAPGTEDGLGDGETLASSPAGSSLGIAEIDAALTVRFPIDTRVGTYAGTLTMTATPSA